MQGKEKTVTVDQRLDSNVQRLNINLKWDQAQYHYTGDTRDKRVKVPSTPSVSN